MIGIILINTALKFIMLSFKILKKVICMNKPGIKIIINMDKDPKKQQMKVGMSLLLQLIINLLKNKIN